MTALITTFALIFVAVHWNPDGLENLIIRIALLALAAIHSALAAPTVIGWLS